MSSTFLAFALAAYAVDPFLGWAVQTLALTTLLVAITALFTRIVRSAGARTRRASWIVATVGLIAIPLFGPRPRQGRMPLDNAQSTWQAAPGSRDLPASRGTQLPLPLWLPLAVWLLGPGVVGLRYFYAVARVRFLMATANAADQSSALSRIFNDMAATLTPQRDIRLLLSEKVGAPVAVGIFRPAVIFPSMMARPGHTPDRAVIAHELEHHAAREPLVRALAVAATALGWFNPTVWLATRELRFEGESLADEAALRASAEKSTYILTLLHFSDSHAERWLTPVAAAMGESQLSRRIRAIAKTDSRYPKRSWVWGAAPIAIAIAATWIASHVSFKRASVLQPFGGVFVEEAGTLSDLPAPDAIERR